MNNQAISNQVFVPVTDDLIYETPEKIEGPLVPYLASSDSHGWLSIEINPEDDVNDTLNKSTDRSHLRLV